MSALYTASFGNCSFHWARVYQNGIMPVLVKLGTAPHFVIATMWSHGIPSFAGNPHVHVPKREPWTNPTLGITTSYFLVAEDFLETTNM